MTDIEKIRLNIGDKSAPYVFTDAELLSFLDDEGSVRLASAAALEAWAATYGANPDSEHIGDYSYNQRIIDNMLKLAERLRKTEAETPAMDWASLQLIEEADE